MAMLRLSLDNQPPSADTEEQASCPDGAIPTGAWKMLSATPRPKAGASFCSVRELTAGPNCSARMTIPTVDAVSSASPSCGAHRGAREPREADPASGRRLHSPAGGLGTRRGVSDERVRVHVDLCAPGRVWRHGRCGGAARRGGCDDATVGIGRWGRLGLAFAREAESAGAAVAAPWPTCVLPYRKPGSRRPRATARTRRWGGPRRFACPRHQSGMSCGLDPSLASSLQPV